MACKMTERNMNSLAHMAKHGAKSCAGFVARKNGSLGSAREAAIAAFTRGFDQAAAELMEGGDV
jgi:hypothetical protein